MNVHSHAKHVRHHQNVSLALKALITMQTRLHVYWIAPHQHSTTIPIPHAKAANIHVHHVTTTQRIVSVVHNLIMVQYCIYTIANASKHAPPDTTLMTLEFVTNVMVFVWHVPVNIIVTVVLRDMRIMDFVTVRVRWEHLPIPLRVSVNLAHCHAASV